MSAYYNDNDPFVCQWLKNLIAAGHLPGGKVDCQSIRWCKPNELRQYNHAHFFAGIGGWAYALRLAGWPDDRPVWTGSCPCQPFSSAGKRLGTADPRHLWPRWFDLIRECRPPVVFGEQVASRDGLAWLDIVSADLEGEGYAVRALDLCAAGFGAPHIRQRLYFVADAEHVQIGSRERGAEEGIGADEFRRERPASGGSSVQLADAECGSTERQRFNVAGAASDLQGETRKRQRIRDHAGDGLAVGELGNASQPRLQEQRGERGTSRRQTGTDEGQAALGTGSPTGGVADTECDGGRSDKSVGGSQGRTLDGWDRPGPVNGFWRDAEWLPCSDGKSRAVKPSIEPLAARVPARVGRLRAYGNSIVPQVAAAFVREYMDGDA